jgi:LPXTG-motif cell wall-anchored protein
MESAGLAPKTGSTTVTILAVIELVLVGVCGYFLSTLVGNPDTANDLTKTLLPVTGILGGIVMIHTFLWYTYFTYHPLSMNLYFLMSTAISLVVSLTALSIALIQKS